ncbi:hypothetical protein ABH920_004845 [Catenulispora sp. EB89]|uniref:hypothetical protein n=1 Tax=Catenulispora sp. EB89 TaxID=3156257 RepID=UPI00351137FB
MDPDPDYEARQRWAQLPKEVRKEVIKRARKNEPIPDPRLAKIALGWAWAIQGPPGARKQVGAFTLIVDLIGNLMLPEGKGTFKRVDIFDGARHHDLNLVVRRTARQVERANYSGPPPA